MNPVPVRILNESATLVGSRIRVRMDPRWFWPAGSWSALKSMIRIRNPNVFLFVGSQKPCLPRLPRWKLPQPRLLRPLHARWDLYYPYPAIFLEPQGSNVIVKKIKILTVLGIRRIRMLLGFPEPDLLVTRYGSGSWSFPFIHKCVERA